MAAIAIFLSASPVFKIFQRYFMALKLESEVHHKIYKAWPGTAHLFPSLYLATPPGVPTLLYTVVSFLWKRHIFHELGLSLTLLCLSA